MKILVFCPLAPSAPRIFGRTVETILRQDYAPLHFHFNAGDNPYEHAYDNITHNFNMARSLALRGGYDALMTVESDMVLPHDAVSKLAGHLENGADVAYGLYVWRHGMHRWSAYTELWGLRGKSLIAEPEMARKMWGKTMEVSGVGLGCTLISRRILQGLMFHVEDYTCSCDWWFATDCVREGYKQVCDLSVVCGHITLTPSHQILWPDPKAEKLYRIDFRGSPPPENITYLEDGRVAVDITHVGETPIPFKVVDNAS